MAGSAHRPRVSRADPADARKPEHEVVLLLNFFDELRRRVPEAR